MCVLVRVRGSVTHIVDHDCTLKDPSFCDAQGYYHEHAQEQTARRTWYQLYLS